MSDSHSDITRMLDALSQGDSRVADALFPMIYDELRSHAGRLMGSERRDHTLQRTALVHEAYLKLVRPGANYQSRLHFFNAAAQAMRRILIDHAAARKAQKRGGGQGEISLDDVDPEMASDLSAPAVDLLSLDGALDELKERSPRQAQVVMLRFFACLKDAEIADLLQVSEKTVRRDWTTARIWLYGELNR